MAESRDYAIITVECHIMTETVVLGESGRIVLPVAIRKEFGLEPGERLTVIAEQGEIRILSRSMILERVRARILEKRGTLTGILDEFLEERREEARREAAGK
jgi:AbrB family looped-hinge helix DNA binding protein